MLAESNARAAASVFSVLLKLPPSLPYEPVMDEVTNLAHFL